MKYRKKIMKYCLEVGVFMLMTLSACNQNTSEEKEVAGTPDAVEKKKSEVMAIHDKIMPRIGTLMNLKKQLKEKAAAIDTGRGINKEQLDTIQIFIEKLENADEAMMQWMRTYKDPADSVSEKEALSYLELKEQEIVEVKEKMQQSEADARALLNNN